MFLTGDFLESPPLTASIEYLLTVRDKDTVYTAVFEVSMPVTLQLMLLFVTDFQLQPMKPQM